MPVRTTQAYDEKRFNPSKFGIGNRSWSIKKRISGTQQLADALGVSISSIKRWVDKGVIKATRTTGKHRLVSLSSALQFARDEKYPTGNLLAMSVGPVIDTIDDRLVEALLEALKSGNSRQASSIVASAFQSHRDAVALADQLIRPVMERVGQLWLLGALDIYQEHQATQTLVSSLLDLIRKLSQDDSAGRPLALGASPEGDVLYLAGPAG